MEGVQASGLSQILEAIGQWFVKWGGYASAVVAFFAVFMKYDDILCWWRKKRKAKYDREHATENKILEQMQAFKKDVEAHLNRIDDRLEIMQDDIVVSQMNDLKSLYGADMSQGNATLEQKTGFYALYDRYHKQGRNSLTETMKEDIEHLPNRAPTRGEVLYREYG